MKYALTDSVKATAIGIVSLILNVSGLGPRDVPYAIAELNGEDDDASDDELSCRMIGGVSLPGRLGD